ncbi:hypothetical protein C8J57DRAFT_1179712 [Mycena rebaudengoi]|nr:hypothetical protein C8J57DRAFT_1179712 [Mycena rebaudengoi]
MTDVSVQSTNSPDPEVTRVRAAALGAILDEFLAKKITFDDLEARLKAAGGTDAEIREYLKLAKDNRPSSPSPGPEGDSGPDSEATRLAFERAAALLAGQNPAGDPSGPTAVEAFLSSIVGNRTPLGVGLSPSLLALAPHLGTLSTSTSDAHLDQTWKLRQALAKEPNLDVLTDSMQQQPLHDPIPRSIWKDVLQDKFISFPKLFATMEPGYDHRDEAKEFHGGFSLVRKDHITARKPVTSESDWTRVFDAWSSAVTVVFAHRVEELSIYRGFVVALFRDVPDDPGSTIRIDNEIRDLYAKNPFHLDDETRLNRLVMASLRNRLTSSTTSLGKRSAISPPSAGIEPETTQSAPTSTTRLERERLQIRDRVEQALKGPRSLVRGIKRKADEVLYNPRFRRGLMWSGESDNNISPSVLYIETAPPLPSPPQHLLDDPVIRAALRVHRDAIKEQLKPRIITDQTASGLNDGIPREDAKVKYDDMRSFGYAMRAARDRNPGKDLILFKDDITGAFPTLPAHPIWQLRQVVLVNGSLHIVQLLLLWDRLRIPYGNPKQDHGRTLKIIGFWVDINIGTISLTPSSISDLVDRIAAFLARSDRKPPLREWQQLTGHLNWALNVLPWGRPALSELYRKMEGKIHARAGIFINAEVIESLSWFQTMLTTAIGIRFIDDDCWDDREADMVMWTDASLKLAIGFVYGNKGFVYQLKPTSDPKMRSTSSSWR